jgi:glyoxylase-like metal-dependent hydrolase (beta-lactamase superfamily II)
MWEVFALRYATHDRLARENFLRPPDNADAPMPIDYFIWLLRGDGREILVDTGFSPEVCTQRGRRMVRSVPDLLADMGSSPPTVRDLIITHLHYDHAGNLDLFPNARFHLQEREMAFATGRSMGHACLNFAFNAADTVRMVRAVYSGRVVFHDGIGEVAPGVTVHRVGGHTAGLQVVRVETSRGPLVLASDAAHFYANLTLENPFPILADLGEMAEGWRTVRSLAGGDLSLVVPGHDPEVLRHYPKWQSHPDIVCLHLW